jgi:iron-sulfur cluster repair protein YtfE (RIC family)
MLTLSSDDVVSQLTDDHETVEQLLERFETTPQDLRMALLWNLAENLVRHHVAEEAVLFPVLCEIPGGKRITQTKLEEHAAIEKHVIGIELVDPAQDEFLSALAELRIKVLDHSRHEEEDAFLLLERNVQGSELLELGELYYKVKALAPPLVPPSRNSASVPVSSMIEHVRAASLAQFRQRSDHSKRV